nr:immunoglobulin light chain junction region [Macaca mulatta]MOV62646.1 immunoglobulin light chain junction region [Macaca mulatta]MOV63674.1 immunoglobulin light chain junction region [Macaca mulatta]MOV63957.1 immunoglobulin light chain junction region [Macaca mulatta]MOV64290.1 immunoglobulin light chain junction region [Macaca mulatta]
CQQYHSTPWSF